MIGVWEKKLTNDGTDSAIRAVYHFLDFANPDSPTIVTETKESGPVPYNVYIDPPTNYPLAHEWDTVVAAGGSVAWVSETKLRETRWQPIVLGP